MSINLPAAPTSSTEISTSLSKTFKQEKINRYKNQLESRLLKLAYIPL